MKRVLVAVLALLICAIVPLSVAAQQNTIVIGLSLGTLQQERWTNEKAVMEKYVASLGNVKLLVQAADSDATVQASQAENLLAQNVNVLIVVPQDAEAAGVIVSKAHAVGVPVIAYDRMITKSDVDAYVSFDSVKVGELMAQYLVKRVPRGNYLILKGGPTDNNAHLVYEGQMNVLKKYIDSKAIKIVADQWCENWSPEIALKHTEDALTASGNKIDAIATGWDGLAGAAIQALAAQGLAGKVLVTGQDADLSACQAIVEGKQAVTIYKPLAQLAKAGIDTAILLAKHNPLKVAKYVNNGFKDVPAVLPDIIAVDKSNIVDVIIKGGFRQLEDVYKNVPKVQWPKL
jgi:D-xylose transport system substrate-binding protein